MVTKSEQTISTFITSFQKANMLGVDKIDTTTNNIGLIDKLLAQFMNMDDYSQEVKDSMTAKSSIPPLPSYNARTPHIEIWINGTRVIYPGKKDDTDVSIGLQRNPGETDADWEKRQVEEPFTGPIPNIDVFFKDLNLDMAFAGPIGTIHGSLILFSRDPLDLLSFLYDFSSNLDEISGLPTVSVRFGWDIADFDTPILTPMLDFLVMSVEMADPSVDSQGSVFTLTLQDTGSAVYDNSSADFALIEDFPQQQLRVLVERVMGIRLFTLDDLLALNESGNSIVSKIPTDTQLQYKTLDPNNSSDLVILNLLAQKLQAQEKATTGGVTTGRQERYGLSIDKSIEDPTCQVDVSIDALSNINDASLWEIIGKSLQVSGLGSNENSSFEVGDTTIADFITTMKSEYSSYMNAFNQNSDTFSSTYGGSLWQMTSEYDSGGKGTYWTPARNLVPAVKSLYDFMGDINNAPAGIVYFPAQEQKAVLLKSAKAAILVNMRFTLANLPNLKSEVKRLFTVAQAVDKNTLLTEVISKYDPQQITSTLTQIYAENPSLLTKTFFVNGKNPALRLNSGSFRDVITDLVMKTQCRWYPINNSNLEQSIKDASTANEEAYKKYRDYKNAFAQFPGDPKTKQLRDEYQTSKMKKSTSCRLVYVTNFPKKYQTTSHTTYIKEGKVTDGAFILIPNINPLETTDEEIPLIYGPGGSNYPYLYGGAQNIKQVLLEHSGKLPTMFGEVIDAKVNYNNLTALIKGNFNEEVAVAEAGKRISRSTTIKPGLVDDKTPEQKKQDAIASREQRKKILEEQLNRLYPHKSPEWIEKQMTLKLDKISSDLRAGGKLKDYATFYQGRRKLYKADSDPNTPPRDRTYSNPIAPEASAKDFIGQRLSNLMYSSTSISMALMGDPFLIRQGIGAFELIHYFLDKKGTGLRYNYLLSGIFLVTSVNHSISAGSFITNIKAYKIPPVDNTFINAIDTWRKQSLLIQGTDGKMIANPHENTNLTQAMTDLMTQSIVLDAPFTASDTIITTATIQNTEVKNPLSTTDINNFYFNIK